MLSPAAKISHADRPGVGAVEAGPGQGTLGAGTLGAVSPMCWHSSDTAHGGPNSRPDRPDAASNMDRQIENHSPSSAY